MSSRTAAIIIDNFLSNSQWQYIQNNISDYLHNDTFLENRNEPYGQTIVWVKEKLKSLDIWREHWENTIDMWSYINSLPSGINREMSGRNDGYHSEFGGFVYYAHPSWDSSWGGYLKFKDCSVEKIEPKPNRFVWINPAVWHGIEVVNSNALHNRVTIVGWPEGCVEYSSASLIINTSIEV
jgi:hypothetical protein